MARNKRKVFLTIFIILALVLLAFIIGRAVERNRANDDETTPAPAATREIAPDDTPAGEPGDADPATGEEGPANQLAPPQEPPAQVAPGPEGEPEMSDPDIIVLP